MDRRFYVYMLTNFKNTVIYTGVTNDLMRRVFEHRMKLRDGFTKRYNITKLVYYEEFVDVKNALAREKRIKGGSRRKKVELIDKFNPEWRDLFEEM